MHPTLVVEEFERSLILNKILVNAFSFI